MLGNASIMMDRPTTPVSRDINSRIASCVLTLRKDLGMTLDGLAT
jgi:hypothetical protein